jgi:Ras-related protein Rab-32
VLPLQDNINIDEATRFLVENMLANQQSFPSEEIDLDRIKLVEEPPTTKPRSQCC